MTNSVKFNNSRYHQQSEMTDWCVATFGPGQWITDSIEVTEWTGLPDWTVWSSFGATVFSFKYERDFILFKLKWL